MKYYLNKKKESTEGMPFMTASNPMPSLPVMISGKIFMLLKLRAWPEPKLWPRRTQVMLMNRIPSKQVSASELLMTNK